MVFDLPAFARWNSSQNQIDSLISSGAALASIHGFWGSPPPYRGALVEQLALKAAAASLRSSGRPEDEEAIRDQWWFREPGDSLSPAAAMFRGWRKLTELRRGWSSVAPATLEDLAALLGQKLHRPPDETIGLIHEAISGISNPLRAAAAGARSCFSREENEALAHLTADAVFADRLGWETPLPLLAAHVASPELRSGGLRRRALPSDLQWDAVTCGAYTLAVATVLAVAQRLQRSAEALKQVEPKLRAKGKQAVMDALLGHACLSGATPVHGMSDRGMRRILERLAAAGAIRELTGRPTFRLYGLSR